MATDHKNRDDTQLRGWLRRGDPAADGSEPGAVELARMRRAMLAEAPGRAFPWSRLAWGTALAAMAVLSLTLWSRSWEDGPGVRPLDPGSRIVLSDPVVPAPDPGVYVAAVEEVALEDEIPPAVAAAATVTPDLEQEMDAGTPVAVAAIDAIADGDGAPRKRQIQFVGSGGTKILWTLDSEFKLGT